MDGPVTLMMLKTWLVMKDQAGYQDRKKMRTLRVVRVSVRRRWMVVREGLGGGGLGGWRVGGVFGIWAVRGLEWGGRREREGRER